MDDLLLYSRDDFRNLIFNRDNHQCVVCGEKTTAAHHIIERRLFSDGGYYLDNGVSLCDKHHILAEQTLLSCDELRQYAGIKNIILPDHLFSELKYDKWSNIIQPNGLRLKGELFYDESVQKILAGGGVLDLFQKYVKYQRTYHLPWSFLSKDDRKLKNDDQFHNKRVIVTIKKDGQNSTLYNDYIHARSINGNNHPSMNYLKGLWSNISYLIDDNMRICGEDLYAVHSIQYDNLISYFMVFSVWFDNLCLSWDETVEYVNLLGLTTVEVIYDGIYNKELIIKSFEPFKETEEGYVIRIADSFTYSEFRNSIAKFVRPEFKQMVDDSTDHWQTKKIIPNKLL